MSQSSNEEVTVVEGAVRVDRHPNTIARALRDGALPCRWKSGRRLIRVDDLERWAAATRRHPAPSPEAA